MKVYPLGATVLESTDQPTPQYWLQVTVIAPNGRAVADFGYAEVKDALAPLEAIAALAAKGATSISLRQELNPSAASEPVVAAYK